MDKKHISVLFLGSSGFPYGYANIERQKLLALGLVNEGASVTILNRKGVHSRKKYPDLKASGQYRGVDYIYLGKSPFRPSGFIKRNMLKIVSLFFEIRFLVAKKRAKKLDAIIFNARNFSSLIYYYLLRIFLKVPVAFNYVELNSSMENRTSLKEKINDYLFEHIGLKLIPIILPISDYLNEFSCKKNKRAKCLKIPALCDFELFENHNTEIKDQYILFCGSAAYYETVTFVITSFSNAKIEDYNLFLILNGSKQDLTKVENSTKEMHLDGKVKILSNLPYDELISYYKSAGALIIPIRPTLRDVARFPHKIGEYTASGKPIISNNLGEVSKYFTDDINAFIVSDFDAIQYGHKIKQVLSDAGHAKAVGEQGRITGLENFDCKVNGKRLYDFLMNYLNSKN